MQKRMGYLSNPGMPALADLIMWAEGVPRSSYYSMHFHTWPVPEPPTRPPRHQSAAAACPSGCPTLNLRTPNLPIPTQLNPPNSFLSPIRLHCREQISRAGAWQSTSHLPLSPLLAAL